MSDTQTIAPGWYPDPMDAARRRWWSGLGWTEHVEGAAAPAELSEPDETVVPVRSAARPASSERAVAEALAARSGRGDPYRDREILSKVALGVALVSVLGVAARLVTEVPFIVQLLVSSAPIVVSGFALFVAYRSDARLRMPLLAAAISVGTAAASYSLDAAAMTDMMSMIP